MRVWGRNDSPDQIKTFSTVRCWRSGWCVKSGRWPCCRPKSSPSRSVPWRTKVWIGNNPSMFCCVDPWTRSSCTGVEGVQVVQRGNLSEGGDAGGSEVLCCRGVFALRTQASFLRLKVVFKLKRMYWQIVVCLYSHQGAAQEHLLKSSRTSFNVASGGMIKWTRIRSGPTGTHCVWVFLPEGEWDAV